jgi:hypothetical protein
VLASLDPGCDGPWDAAIVADACTPRNVELLDPMTQHAALRGLGLVVAGGEDRIWRGFAPNHSARQVAWGDPVSGISFAFVTNGAERNPARQGARGIRLSSLAAGALAEAGTSL